ncbi:XkdX family protein [Apilactobacillus sp. TMW 2.2459]|uniref:XkdX family protein n=1 Tax=Apilactobacillus xinyiensis TaxID=2841032 RepID=UPI00200F5C4C|nr:XkdX family protein [Apilactobacillus xinyiensis]MCL0312776.1 XkdX family protein [Apilactobacillus xinyiensis]
MDSDFPTKQMLTDEWNWGWFNEDYDELRVYVGHVITKDDFKEICGIDYDDKTNGQKTNEPQQNSDTQTTEGEQPQQ